MGVALALLILIVWWTWPAKRSGDNDAANAARRQGKSGERR